MNRVHSFSVAVEVTQRYKLPPSGPGDSLEARLRNIGDVESWLRVLQVVGVMAGIGGGPSV